MFCKLFYARLAISCRKVTPVFKLKIADAKLLKDLITSISILVDEATFKIEPDALRLRAMDPSRVAMIDFEMPKTLFEEYVITEPAKMCINIAELLKLLKRAAKEETVELSLDEKTGKLQVAMAGRYARNFTMPTLEASEEEVPTPKITFNVKAKATTDGLSQAIEDAQLVSDHVRIGPIPTNWSSTLQATSWGLQLLCKKEAMPFWILKSKNIRKQPSV